MRAAILNFSGNVGKSTIARHLVAPNLDNPRIFSVETINSGGDGEQIKGSDFGNLQEFLMEAEDCVIDVGSSNVESFIMLMNQYRGSHEDIDLFVVPAVRETKQQMDTIATIETLSTMKVPANKIQIVFNRVKEDESVESVFAPILQYVAERQTCIANMEVVVITNEIYDKLKGGSRSVPDIARDKTDYLSALKNSQSVEERAELREALTLKRLALSANENLETACTALFGKRG